MNNIKKQRNYYSLFFNVYTSIIIITTVLISGRIIPWKILINPNYNISPLLRILISLFVTLIILIPCFILTLYKKYKVYHFTYISLVVGITITTTWLPLVLKDNNDVNYLEWCWYKCDVIPILIIYITIYFVSSVFINNKKIKKLRVLFKIEKDSFLS
ncbi:hypothetical protein RRG38_02755 [Mycoplasmopsis felis]|uniref:hypothetical protein n=1 Tax=Mycoplasmopsis felis TaxID=33923 RepID=UPI002AF6CD1B|nr:hypothetical protein [Mycoplasmopsis felis]WQQ02731.1 hypothetical protein RNN91_01455 [Mycoplasmopsis felis]